MEKNGSGSRVVEPIAVECPGRLARTRSDLVVPSKSRQIDQHSDAIERLKGDLRPAFVIINVFSERSASRWFLFEASYRKSSHPGFFMSFFPR